MPKLPPLAAVRVFEAAARQENFTRAAEELAMTQAGVSYQIKLLEDRLGTRLFARRGRGMELTALGRRIAPRVSDAFAMLERAFAAARSENETVLSVTTSRSFATCWLSGRLGAFQLRHPDLAVRLDVADQLVDLEADEFDVAIRGVAVPPPGATSHFLMRQVFTPMASPEFLARHPISHPDDLADLPRISPQDIWWPLWLERVHQAAHTEPPRGGVRFDSQAFDGQAALAGHGVAMLSPAMFARDIESGRLVAPLAEMAEEPRAFWLCYASHKARLAKVRAFRDWLLDEVREAAGDDPYGVLRAPGPG